MPQASGCKPPHLPAQDGGEVGYVCGLRVDWQDSELRAQALACLYLLVSNCSTCPNLMVQKHRRTFSVNGGRPE